MTRPGATPQLARATAEVDGRTVSYRQAGSGPAVVLVGSPSHSSAPDSALITALSGRYSVWAIDPPGYGFSDRLDKDADADADAGVEAMAAALAATLTAIGVDRAAVVARHTGGPVALELTRREPDRFPLLVLDDVPLLDAATRAVWAREFGSVITAQFDGSHLLRHWSRRRSAFVYSPWFDVTSPLDLDLRGSDVLETSVHSAVLDQLDAGEDHGMNDRAAFAYDCVAALRAGTVSLLALTPSHPSLGSPTEVRPDITLIASGREPAERSANILTALASWTSRPGLSVPPFVVGPTTVRGRWTAQFPATPWGQVAARRFRPADEPLDARPLVLLHASPLSGESLRPLATELGRHREVVLLDTLGNGDSDKPDPDRHPEFRHPEIADLARVALAAMAGLGIDEFDVFGTHTGATVALEMGVAAPDRVGALVLDGLPLLGEATAADALANYFVDLTPKWDGSHLVVAWSNVIDVLTWYPWHDRDSAHRRQVELPAVAALHRRVVQMLKGGTSYPFPHTAVMRHATSERLPLLTVPTAFCRAPGDPMAAYFDECIAAVDDGVALDLAADPLTDAPRIAAWLDRVRTSRPLVSQVADG